jgi:DNA-binding CsgD family transcriptional regulator/catechol 2,3-dioxygenase-like lactoylglutathione lyase family enzyme
MVTSRRKGRPPYDDILTPAEWRVVHAVKHGMTNREIAARRGISPDAVKFHVANVLAKLGLPNRRALRRWHQAPKGSALGSLENKMSSPLQLGSIGQISRSVKDIEQSAAWYREVLGLPHLYTFGTLAFFDCGGVRLFLSQVEGSVPADSILYFRVEDIQQAHDALRAKGVDFINAPHMVHRHADGTEEWMAFFKDLEERPLAILSQAKSKAT